MASSISNDVDFGIIAEQYHVEWVIRAYHFQKSNEFYSDLAWNAKKDNNLSGLSESE